MVTFFRTSFFLTIALCVMSMSQLSAEIGIGNTSVTAEIDLYKAYADQPLQGTVSVTHKASSKIDEGSFKLENSSLKVEPISKVNFSGDSHLEMVIYRFTIPGKPQGLYVLPSISVKVDDKTYESIPSSYEVKSPHQTYYIPNPIPSYQQQPNPKIAPNIASQSVPQIQNPATLVLKTSVDGQNPMYPGQTSWFTYRFVYSGNIALTKEQLPLMEAAGFEKIGDKRTKEYEENGLSVTEVAQQVKATKPGTFIFPASFIEGYAYVMNASGERTNLEPKLHSETEPISIEVLAFPTSGKPSTFNGAIGQFTIATSLLSPPLVSTDQEMTLAIDISGTGELGPIQLPDLSQAGFKQLFRLSDLPTLGEISGNTKRFIVKLEPLSSSVKQIPAVPFSYFDPLANIYNTVNSNPISITVNEERKPQTPPTPVIRVPSERENIPDNSQTYFPKAVQIEGNMHLSTSDLYNLTFGTWKVLWIIPLGAAFIFFIIGLKKHLHELKTRIPTKTSSDYLQEALNSHADTPTFYNCLSRAFLLRLKEKNLIINENILPEKLPLDGILGEVRTFLYSLEEQRFTGKKLEINKVKTQAKELYAKVE